MDDSKATNVEATYVGLIGLKEQKSVVLLGGLAKVVVFLLAKYSMFYFFGYIIACYILHK